MKIKFKHIMLTIGVMITLILGIGGTAQILLPSEVYNNSFFNHGLTLCLIWTFLVGVIIFLIKLCKEV